MKNDEWPEAITLTMLTLIAVTFIGLGISTKQQADDLKKYIHDHECVASTPIPGHPNNLQPGHPDNPDERFYHLYTCKNGNTFIREMK